MSEVTQANPVTTPSPKKGMGCGQILLAMIAIFAALLVAFAGFVQMQPSEFQVSRSARMKAAPLAVFEQVNDFHKWDGWSPWAKIDPASKTTFEGPESGEGAKFSWDSKHPQVGAGSMQITKSQIAERVELDLQFRVPFESKCLTVFTFAPEGPETVVTWTMSGKNNFIGKLFSLFMDCDAMVGPDFEKGLANMKSIVEGGDQPSNKSELPPGQSEPDMQPAPGEKSPDTPKQK